ncbi:hypothetical protein OIU74_013430 [Salix koriyanagi]|uniref:Uncharacterized protein n=1 Tax=Salix koriyanagi TaxID=2511006 RepID=A0A9Q0T6H3_9ROSI|nr:hypothetical protein OIU74_013430 [Salix koriyanagi]
MFLGLYKNFFQFCQASQAQYFLRWLVGSLLV